jgi:hypothetical protein
MGMRQYIVDFKKRREKWITSSRLWLKACWMGMYSTEIVDNSVENSAQF